MDSAKPVNAPTNHFRLSIARCLKIDDEVKDVSMIPYESVVGYLIYAMICTRHTWHKWVVW